MIIGIGRGTTEPIIVPIKKACQGYYLRWYYNGFHYWFFRPGTIIFNTKGTRKISMGSGQVTYEQINALRTIRNSREIQLLTIDGWMNLRIEPGSVQVKNNYINGYEMDFVAILGSREGYYSPVVNIPETIINQTDIIITHHNDGVFTIIISGLPGETIIIDWGDGTPPETIVLTGGDDVITHDYTGTTGDQVIVISGVENIITIEADGQEITEITIPPTANKLTELILPNNEITESPEIPISVPLVIIDLEGNPLTICEVVIGTQIWMCKNYDSNYPGSKVYDDDEANRAIYGGLYRWYQVMAEGFCPSGWHVPTQAEWQELIDYVGGDAAAGEHLKEDGTTHWDVDNADNSSGFTALGAGQHVPHRAIRYEYLKEFTSFWTSTPENVYIVERAYTASLLSTEVRCDMLTSDIGWFFSVRLLKNFSAPTPPPPPPWFLPSKDEFNEMKIELYDHGVGNFLGNNYWTSSEFTGSEPNFAWRHNLPLNTQLNGSKASGYYVRACRLFTSMTIYALRDVGPSGGLIFWKSGNDYLEAAPSDQSHAWSNITNTAIGTTGTAIGTGQANTTAIIGQAGHTDSAAKLCNDLVI